MLSTALILCALLIHAGTLSAEAADPKPLIPRSADELDYSDFPKTPLGLNLIATLKRQRHATAMIKSTTTGMLKSFSAGDAIDFVELNEKVTIVQISNCSLVLKRGTRYESLSCRLRVGRKPFIVRSAPIAGARRSPLAGYNVVEDIFEKPPLFKSTYDKVIRSISRKHKVDPYLVKAVIKAESDFNPKAVSTKNAMGMMQLMPQTVSEYGVKDPFNPIDNIDGGVRVLRDLMNYFYGDKRLAIAAYNAGKWAVIKHGFQVPPYRETGNFVERVMGYYSVVDFSR